MAVTQIIEVKWDMAKYVFMKDSYQLKQQVKLLLRILRVLFLIKLFEMSGKWIVGVCVFSFQYYVTK
jgi:hypothetical protein